MSNKVQQHQLSNSESLAEEETVKGNQVVVTPASILVENGEAIDNIRTPDISYINDSKRSVQPTLPLIMYGLSVPVFLVGVVMLTSMVVVGGAMILLSALFAIEGHRRQLNITSPDNHREVLFSTGGSSVRVAVEEDQVEDLVTAVRRVNPKVELVD